MKIKLYEKHPGTLVILPIYIGRFQFRLFDARSIGPANSIYIGFISRGLFSAELLGFFCVYRTWQIDFLYVFGIIRYIRVKRIFRTALMRDYLRKGR